MTNYEKIKNMSVEEMIDFFATADPYECPFECPTCYYRSDCSSADSCRIEAKKWLESEAENE